MTRGKNNNRDRTDAPISGGQLCAFSPSFQRFISCKLVPEPPMLQKYRHEREIFLAGFKYECFLYLHFQLWIRVNPASAFRRRQYGGCTSSHVVWEMEALCQRGPGNGPMGPGSGVRGPGPNQNEKKMNGGA